VSAQNIVAAFGRIFMKFGFGILKDMPRKFDNCLNLPK
jgi:hypothetical protein